MVGDGVAEREEEFDEVDCVEDLAFLALAGAGFCHFQIVRSTQEQVVDVRVAGDVGEVVAKCSFRKLWLPLNEETPGTPEAALTSEQLSLQHQPVTAHILSSEAR